MIFETGLDLKNFVIPVLLRVPSGVPKSILWTKIFLPSSVRRFQKISILYHGQLLGFPKGRGGSQLWISDGMGGYLR